MASLYKKVISGKPYYYLREMGWVDGKPKMVSERYLGSVADIVKAMDAAEAGMMPQRTGHLAFGDVAAAWSLITDLGVAALMISGLSVLGGCWMLVRARSVFQVGVSGLFGQAQIGWYVFLAAGLIGVIGSLKALARG